MSGIKGKSGINSEIANLKRNVLILIKKAEFVLMVVEIIADNIENFY